MNEQTLDDLKKNLQVIHDYFVSHNRHSGIRISKRLDALKDEYEKLRQVVHDLEIQKQRAEAQLDNKE